MANLILELSSYLNLKVKIEFSYILSLQSEGCFKFKMYALPQLYKCYLFIILQTFFPLENCASRGYL